MVLPEARVIGVMSGTSHDGLDLAMVDFNFDQKKYSFEIVKAVEVGFPEELLGRMRNSRFISKDELNDLSVDFGNFIGESINENFDLNGVDLISSHGHTVFHEPNKGITLQIGDLEAIKEKVGVKVAGDFRSLDVQKGGQGAPLVPRGDQMLFSEFEACLNLGGISNISFDDLGSRGAFDVSPCNIVSNYLASKLGQEMDKDGQISKDGELDKKLFDALNSWWYYSNNSQSSLGIEHIEKDFFNFFDDSKSTITNQLYTFYCHIGYQVSKVPANINSKLLVTGGGAKNNVLCGAIQKYFKGEVVIPDDEIVDFKEAIIFAFLGYLRLNEIENILCSYTGASSNSIAGELL